ncbi:UDP-glycosyltransferase 87A1-like [Neltuma alba]|uniref:UDP-glycosyltransferase 87A1-like n=1 Tax=Neltuma alba TaxID=207710 RepID=UPI0010A2D9E6|nr:UDP-glycosyltransferase 87A1-like [Prosopis alba]XP_028792428.1 UDP-glycosyltransferase 87A1-like [Prosopis alba]
MSMEAPPCFKGHVVALPFPTTGHVNPMMNLCKFLASRTADVFITFVVTEEWLRGIESYPKPHTIRFATIPNVVPSESKILDDMLLFSRSIMTGMRAAFEQLLDRLEPPPTVLLSDVELKWPTAVASQRDIPVALLWTMSASFFCTYRQLDILAPAPDRRLTVDLLDEQADYIQGTASSQPIHLRKLVHERDLELFKRALDCMPAAAKTDYLLINTIQELEAEQINYLKAKFNFRVYPIGPAIPFTELGSPSDSSATATELDHILKWLDSQPNMSVLYISMGSLFSMSRPQAEELASALKTSGVRFLWACRSDAEWLKEKCGDKGLVVPWCDQLKVLWHSSIAAFWSHGGWNSTVEACFAGVPILGFPFFLDQFSNCRQIVEGWKNGWKVSDEISEEYLRKEKILELIKMMMDVESEEGKEIRDKARQVKILCGRSTAKGGSLEKNLYAFVEDIVGGSPASVRANHWPTS